MIGQKATTGLPLFVAIQR